MIENLEITLAIESAISGGSLSLLRGDVEIASWVGESNVSRAEDLLFNIDLLLKENNISRNEINLIAASAGPGSFTGIRIGIATALGLKAGLGTPMSSESALKAMVFAAGLEKTVAAALPVGRNAVCIQTFSDGERTSSGVNEPHAITEDDFYAMVQSDTSATFLVHERLYEKTELPSNVVNFGLGLANAIGRICQLSPAVVTEPLFISKNF